VRISYHQPAELRPSLVEAMASTPGVVPYFDLSFQHSAPGVLRRMRRFGDTERFLGLLDTIRSKQPEAGARSNFIVGFPGETEQDLEELAQFLTGARLDAIGVFGYSDEDGTEAAGFAGKLPQDEIDDRVEFLADLAERLTAQRAADRVGQSVEVLVEQTADAEGGFVLEDGGDGRPCVAEGRAAQQGPETDGSVRLVGAAPQGLRAGDFLKAVVVGSDGVDLIAAPS
jgi:tRNA A37 methylthiotransferase MiaB